MATTGVKHAGRVTTTAVMTTDHRQQSWGDVPSPASMATTGVKHAGRVTTTAVMSAGACGVPSSARAVATAAPDENTSAPVN
jgi:hypothetical protein